MANLDHKTFKFEAEIEELKNKGRSLYFKTADGQFPCITTSDALAPFGLDVNENSITLKLSLDKTKKRNQDLYKFITTFEQETLTDLIFKRPDYFSLKGPQLARWSVDKATDKITPCIIETDYGYELQVKFPYDFENNTINVKQCGVYQAEDLETSFLPDEILNELGKDGNGKFRKIRKVELQFSSVTFYGTQCRIKWNVRQLVLKKQEDNPLRDYQNFLTTCQLSACEDCENDHSCLSDKVFDVSKFKFDESITELQNKGKCLKFYTGEGSFPLFKTGIGKMSFGIDVNDSGIPTSMRVQLLKDQSINQELFEVITNLEDRILKILVENPDFFSLKGRHLDSWCEDKAMDRMNPSITETDYGFDLRMKIPYDYRKNQVQENLFYDEEGEKLDESGIKNLIGEKGRQVRFRALLRVSSVSFYGTQCRIMLRLEQVRLAQPTFVSGNTVMDFASKCTMELSDSEDEDNDKNDDKVEV